jgi:glycosyltransferase involved in cell wall biosynthesis
MKILSVVIPVYFNAESLPVLFERLQGTERGLGEAGMGLELVFVDDGSGDASLAELLKIKQVRPATKIVKLTRNFGAYHAVKCGMQIATGDCTVVMAADLQDPTELLLQMAEKWRNGSKFVICTRASREDPPLSKLFSGLFYRLVRTLIIPGYPVGGYDMSLLDKSLAEYVRRSSKNIHTPLLAYWLGVKPEVIVYNKLKRPFGRSRWTFKKKLLLFLDILFGFTATPIRLISCVGFLVSFCSFAYGVVVVFSALFGEIPTQGFASLAALITFLLGLILVMLGIIGEYIWRIFEEINRRPEVVIDEIY